MSKSLKTIGLLVVALWTIDASAQEASADAASKATDPNATDSPDSSKNYLRKAKPAPQETEKIAQQSSPDLKRVSLALLLVLGLGVVAVYAKRQKGGGASLRNQIRLHSLGALQLGPKSKVALLSVGREALLLGVTEQGISCLRRYPEDELWSLTSALPGFADEIREQEQQEKLAKRPKVERSILDKGVDRAFSELLNKVSHSAASQVRNVAPVSQEQPGSSLENANTSTTHSPADAFVPSLFSVGSTLSKKTGGTGDYSDQSNLDEFPPHLAALLAETQDPSSRAKTTEYRATARANVVPLRNQQPAGFSEADGQATELARRFAELRS